LTGNTCGQGRKHMLRLAMSSALPRRESLVVSGGRCGQMRQR
jgi:hypothetical protein